MKKSSKQNKKYNRRPRGVLAFAVLFFSTPLLAKAAEPVVGQDKEHKVLYSVGYAHLDTQWRWTYPQVIRQFLANTLKQNFPLIDKYPHYVFNFTGSRRYMMMKEYFPEEYYRMKQYIADGRWYPGGSNVDETDQLVPNAESVVRQVLYGNQYFKKEFGKAGVDFIVPDCFGFPASLPSVLAHCSIKGFSTQKLSWGSAIGIPFNVGTWEGTDGQSVTATLNPGAYTGQVTTEMSHDQKWIDRVTKDGDESGVYADYRYYGTGDRGGAPNEKSIQFMEKSVTGDGPLKIISGNSDQIFKDLTDEQKAKLPKYKGELLLTWHSTGSATSQGYMKRWNRRNEELADSAERASVAALAFGNTPYPSEKLYNAWILVLGSQMHDILPGDCLPKAYEYSWNDEVLALNAFSAVIGDATGGVASQMDTQAKGIPLVVYNSLAMAREDVVEATVSFPGEAPKAIQVTGPDGKPVLSQILSTDGSKVKIAFLANVPSLSFTTFDVQPATEAATSSELKVTDNSVENARYLVKLNAAGDVESVFDKKNNQQLNSAPLQLGFLHQNPSQYPAWNMDWEDRREKCQEFVHGPAKIRVVENGPVRVALEVSRETRGSTITQQIRLSSGTAGDRVEFPTHLDWRSTECTLEAVMPMAVSNPKATYDVQVGTVQRGNNDPKKYEVPQQKWLDLTDTAGKYGVSVLNDCKYTSDKPDDSTIRLTLMYTPGVRGGYQDEGSQDFGRHDMTYALQGHTGNWQDEHTVEQAARLNEPMMAFQSPAHPGSLGKSYSVLSVSSRQVAVQAMKKAEASDEIIVRVKETDGKAVDNALMSFATPVVSAREVDGQEAPLGEAKVQDGKLAISLTPYRLKAFAVKLAPAAAIAAATESHPVELPFDLDVVSSKTGPADGKFDDKDRAYAADLFPAQVISEGMNFKLGSAADGQKNALACNGQTVNIPAGSSRVYVLASASGGDLPATFTVGDQANDIVVQNWTSPIGQFDNRLWKGKVSELTYNWDNRLDGLVPGFIKRDTVAWFGDHRRHPEAGVEIYEYTYLFKYGFDVPTGATSITLPKNDKIRVFAITAASKTHDAVTPAAPLYDTLENHIRDTAPSAIVVGSAADANGVYHDTLRVTIAPPTYWQDGYLHYTTDGSEPTDKSPVYTEPLTIAVKTTIKARQFDVNGHTSPIMDTTFDVQDNSAPTVVSGQGMTNVAKAQIVFSEPIDKKSAEDVNNYKIDSQLKVQSATLAANQMSVELQLSGAPSENLSLQVRGVKDLSPAANTAACSIMIPIAKPAFALASFSAGGGKSLEQPASALPTKSSEPFTINCFVKADKQPADKTVILGFGTASTGTAGLGRYICKFRQGFQFWSDEHDVKTQAPLDLDKWQMLTAVYDGRTLTLYKNAQQIGTGALSLADDAPIVHIAPLDPWEKKTHFEGEFRSVAIWPTALSPDWIRALRHAGDGELAG